MKLSKTVAFDYRVIGPAGDYCKEHSVTLSDVVNIALFKMFDIENDVHTHAI